jgi:hypothetical protein
LHPKFSNKDYVSHLRRDWLEAFVLKNDWGGYQAWLKRSPERAAFVKHSSMNADAGYLYLQLPWMAQQLAGFQGALSTDAVEGFIRDPPNTSLLCTVGWCAPLNRTVVLAVSILFGKSAEHHEKHFDALWLDMNLEVRPDGSVDWPGMVVDFSQAQKAGLLRSLARYIRVAQPGVGLAAAEKSASGYLVVRD